MPRDDLDRFCCQNPDCPLHGQRGAGNLSVCGHYGKAHHRLLYCSACKARFSEFKGTPLFNSKLPHEKVLAILNTSPTAVASARPPGWWRSIRIPSPDWPCSPGVTPRPPTTSSWLFPPVPARSSSMRNGPSSARSRRTATPMTRPTTTAAITGTTSPTTRSTGWSLAVIPGARTEENGHAIVEEVEGGSRASRRS